MKKVLLSTALLSITSLSAVGHETTVTYEAKKGFAETLSVSQTEQLGIFKLVLKPVKGTNYHKNGNSKHHKNKSSNHRKGKGSNHHNDIIVIKGAMKGALNPDFTINHTLVNTDRTGALYTANDTITMVYGGDPTCDNGTGTTPFEVEETLYIASGTGVYSGIEPGSYIEVYGVINNCPSLPEYGQNNFEIIGGVVTITQ